MNGLNPLTAKDRPDTGTRKENLGRTTRYSQMLRENTLFVKRLLCKEDDMASPLTLSTKIELLNRIDDLERENRRMTKLINARIETIGRRYTIIDKSHEPNGRIYHVAECVFGEFATAIVAVVNPAPVNDWSAYIGAAPGNSSYEQTVMLVASSGEKLRESTARVLFPNITETWRA